MTGAAVTEAPVRPVHRGVHDRGVPVQPTAPAASKACSTPSDPPTYTNPLATAGDASTRAPTSAVQSGTQDLRAGAQPRDPAASKTESTPAVETVYTLPAATAGDELRNPVYAVQSGKHVLGVPEQPVVPVAS